MNVQEKQAWFNGIIAWAAGLGFLFLGALTKFHPAGQAVFALLALGAFTPMIGRKERKAGKAVEDERDREISQRASIIAYSVFWVCFVIAAMGPFYVLGPNAKITLSTSFVASSIWAAWCVVQGVRSLAIIVMYRSGAHEREA